MPITITRTLPFCLLLASVLLIPSCSGKHGGDEDGETSSSVQPLVSVETAAVMETDIAATIEATGKTDAIRRGRILAPVGGTLISFSAMEGQTVRAGEVLAEIRTRESQAAIAGAEAMLRAASTDAERAQRNHDLELATATQTTVKIRAPFDGVITNRLASSGEMVSENAELATAIDLTTLYFLADVPASLLSGLRAGQACKVTFASLPGRFVGGIVEAVGGQTDAQSQTVKARIRFNHLNAGDRTMLKTEMPGTAEITTGIHRRILAVPRHAVIRDDERNTLEVVCIADSIAVRVAVSGGLQNDSLLEISGKGIVAGTRIVTVGASTLPDSTHVRVVTGTR